MANSAAIAAAGKSIERLLNAAFENSPPVEGKNTHAVLVRTDDFKDANVGNVKEVSTEALMRTFDSLRTDYRLSVPYIARVLRVDGRQRQPDVPVTTLVDGLVRSARR